MRNSCHTSDVLWIVMVCLTDVTAEAWEAEQARLIAYISDNATLSVPVTSCSIQIFNGLSNPTQQDKIQCILGSEYIHETLLSKEFRVSPGAFFQVNTKGAEVLYSIVRDCVLASGLDAPANESVLLDVCCGAGTIGLCLSDYVKQVSLNC